LFIFVLKFYTNMQDNKFSIQNFGPIKSAEVEFGDLTFVVGPQASGKSFLLQAWKLYIDTPYIRKAFRYFSQNYGNDRDFVKLYYGMFRGDLGGIDLSEKSSQDQSVYYIPAQRALCLYDGRPKTFAEYATETPFVVKQFSDRLNVLFQSGDSMLSNIGYPYSIYHDGVIYIDKSSLGKSELRMRIDGVDIPNSSWSAGQREYTPLNMAFYDLHTLAQKPEYVVIEEPEMGLHTKAIVDLLNEVVRLMAMGFKVIISTHSQVIMDFAWGLYNLRTSLLGDFVRYMRQTINCADDAASALHAKLNNVRTYYINNGFSKDITTLDPSSEDTDVSECGGLGSFNFNICNSVADNMSKNL